MPLVRVRCVCGREFDDLRGNTIVQTECRCTCGSIDIAVIPCGGAIFAKGDEDQYDRLLRPENALELQMVMENRAWLEQPRQVAMRDSGEIEVAEKGPNFTRPFGNESSRRFY